MSTPVTAIKPAAEKTLWWADEAWNEETMNWMVEAQQELGTSIHETVLVNELIPHIGATIPQVCPSAEWLTEYFIRTGELLPTADDPTGPVSRQETKFRYDPTGALSRPVQYFQYLYSVYVEHDDWQFSARDFQTEMKNRLDALLRVIPFTATEMDWLVDFKILSPNSNLYRNVIFNPVFGDLPALPNLRFVSPVFKVMDDIDASLLQLEEKTSHLIYSSNPTLHYTEATIAEANPWFASPHIPVDHLESCARILDQIARNLITLLKRANAVSPLSAQQVETLLEEAATALLRIQDHPKWENGKLDAFDRIRQVHPVAAQTAREWAAQWPHTLDRLVNPDEADHYLGEDHIADVVGFSEPVLYVGIHANGEELTETQSTAYALYNYTEDQARELFRNTILTEVSNPPTSQGRHIPFSVLLAPMFGAFFKEIADEFGESGTHVPFSWMVAAATRPHPYATKNQ